MQEIKNVLVDNQVFCPECNAILITNSTSGEKECPNHCELIEYLD